MANSWRSWLYHQLRDRRSGRQHRIKPFLRFTPQLFLLEDRLVLSISVDPLMPPPTQTDPNKVMVYDVDPTGVALPIKTITITNNFTDQTIYPVLRDANSSLPPEGTFPGMALYDPFDNFNEEYRGYIGYVGADNKYYFGLPAGASITFRVPLVFWDAARMGIVTNPDIILPAEGAPNPYHFHLTNADGTPTDRAIVEVGNHGVVMWYHAKKAEAPESDATDQLIEWTIRDAYLGNPKFPTASAIKESEKHALVNYDVSYVDNMLLPVAMEATNVPVPVPPLPFTNPLPYGWIGTSLSFKEMQDKIKAFTSDGDANGLGDYFGGKGWPYYVYPDQDTAGVKVPSGASIFGDSPLKAVVSSYDSNTYRLSSGGAGQPIQFIIGDNGQHPTKPNVISLNPLDPNIANIDKIQAGWDVTANPPGDENLLPGTKVESVDVPNKQITLTQNTTGKHPTGNVYTFKRPVDDYAANALINLWYSWAQYYLDNNTGIDVPDVTASTVKDSRVMTFTAPVTGLVPGSGVKGPNIRPGTTVVSIAPDKMSVKLSQLASSTLDGKYSFVKPQPILASNEASPYTLDFRTWDPVKNPELDPMLFSQKVYQVMSAMSIIPLEPTQNNPAVVQLMFNVIGGSTGKLGVDETKADGLEITTDVRDALKSVLRGVTDFATYDESKWYPDPSVHTGGKTFNVYNLDPFVWFVHVKLGLSGYGFSFDDDVADIGADYATALAVSVGGINNGLPNKSEWTWGAPYGPIKGDGTVDAKNAPNQITLSSATVFWQVNPTDKFQGLGAFVSGPGVPPNTRIMARGDLNAHTIILTNPLDPNLAPGTYSYRFFGKLSQSELAASLSGPASGVRSQPRHFTFAADDPFTDDPAAQYTYTVDWGDGQSQTVQGDSEILVDHVYTETGNYEVTLTATDGDGVVSKQVSHTIAIVAAEAQPDPVNPTKTAFVIGGTQQRDVIQISGAGASYLNGTWYRPTGISRVIAYGGGGDDVLNGGNSSIPVWLFGGDGNDYLVGSLLADVMVGGSGNDQIVGRGGADVMIGSGGNDTLAGGNGSALMIGGMTAFDRDVAALAAIHSEWTSLRSYEAKVANLRGDPNHPDFSQRTNGNTFLRVSGPDVTVVDDQAKDQMFNPFGRDWFFASLGGSFSDGLPNLHPTEIVENLG